MRVAVSDARAPVRRLRRRRARDAISRAAGSAAAPESARATQRACASNCGNGTTFHGSPMKLRLGPEAGGNTCSNRGATRLSTLRGARRDSLSEADACSSCSSSPSNDAKNGNVTRYPVAYSTTSTSRRADPSSNKTPEVSGSSAVMPGARRMLRG